MKMKILCASLLIMTPWAIHSMAPQGPAINILNPARDKSLAGYADGSVKIFDETTQHVLHVLKGPTPNQPIRSGAFDPTGEKVATGSRGIVEIWDVMTGNLIRIINVGAPAGPAVLIGTVMFLEDNIIRFTPEGHPVQIWDVTTGNRIA